MTDKKIEITRENTGNKGRYVVRQADGAEAVLTFTEVGTRQRILDHTEVPEAFRGQGVGYALVARGVEDARSEGRTLIPLCPFAATQFRRHPEWSDVLRK